MYVIAMSWLVASTMEYTSFISGESHLSNHRPRYDSVENFLYLMVIVRGDVSENLDVICKAPAG